MNSIKVKKSELQWGKNGSIIAIGPPSSGKTFMINELILNRNYVFKIPPKCLVLLYSKWNDVFGQWKRIFEQHFYSKQGYDSEFIEQIFARRGEHSTPLLVIIDDLIEALVQKENKSSVLRLINVYCTHGNAYVIVTSQQCTMEGSAGVMLRNIIRTAAGIVIFDNVLSLVPLRSLSISLFTSHNKPSTVLTKILEKNSNFGYRFIFIDINASNYERDKNFIIKQKLLRVRNSFYTKDIHEQKKPYLFYT